MESVLLTRAWVHRAWRERTWRPPPSRQGRCGAWLPMGLRQWPPSWWAEPFATRANTKSAGGPVAWTRTVRQALQQGPQRFARSRGTTPFVGGPGRCCPCRPLPAPAQQGLPRLDPATGLGVFTGARCRPGSAGVQPPRRRRGEKLTRPQDSGREVGVVGGVRKVLCLQRQSVALTVCSPTGADMGTVQGVAAVQPQPGLVGQHLRNPSTGRVGQSGAPAQAR
jgi:hypothetical protein